MVMQSVVRFQIWLVTLNPTKGREINKTRPCVVISPDEMLALSTVLVAPMTSKGFDFPCRVPIHFQQKQGLILLDQIRAVDKSRLVKQLGQLDQVTQITLCERLQEIFTY
jgi:mRNA interferase MazF